MKKFFKVAFDEALKGIKGHQGGPFGAVIVRNGKVIAACHNTVLRDNDPTCHAEINAIRTACKKMKQPHLNGCILIASSEPCPMCLTSAYWAQIKKIYYAVPRKVAASVGFSDDFIYKDIAKPQANRKIPLVRYKGSEEHAKTVFRVWKKSGGKLY